jgi:DNA replication protein DnaC
MLVHPTLTQLTELGLAGARRVVAERARQPDLAGAAGTGDDQIVMAPEPLAGGELLEEAPIEAAVAVKSISSAQAWADLAVLYHRLPRLFAELALARGDGRYPRLFRSLCRVHLLILDDWGPEPMTAEQRRDLLEIIEDRYGRASTLVTSQIPVSRWHDVVGEPTLADAILDRLVHNAHRIELEGDSLRKRKANRS